MTTDTVDSDTYTIKGKSYARVTSILKARGLVDFSKIPERDREFYMDRGTANHDMWQKVEEGTAANFHFDPRVQLYRPAHARFLRETGFHALPGGIEQKVWNDDLRIAGRLDRIGTIQGRVCLIDYKTSTVHPATAIQTAMYLLCLDYPFHEVERYGVAFRNDGTYRMSEKYKFSDKADALRHIHEYHREIK